METSMPTTYTCASMRISTIPIGVDPSLASCGASDGQTHDRIETRASLSPYDRASEIIDRIGRLIDVQRGAGNDALLVVEGPLFFGSDATATWDAGYLMARIDLLAKAYGVSVVVVQPTTLKKFVTGRGNAPKTEVALEILDRWGVRFHDDRGADKAHAYGLHRYGLAYLAGEIDHHAPAARGSKKKPLKKITFEMLSTEQLVAIGEGRVALPIEIPKHAPLVAIPAAWLKRAQKIAKQWRAA